MNNLDITNSPTSNVLKFPKSSTNASDSLRPKTELGTIEAKMRKVIDTLKETNYPDTFDWSVYDKISARFGDRQPRGGVVFNTTLKLVNYHTSCGKCHYAFEIDSYGRGCIHECAFCYAKDQLVTHGYWNRPFPFPVNLAEVRKIFYTVFETDRPSKWRSILSQRIPIRIGSMSDSFMWIDRKYRITQELLKILNYYNYPYVIFTRSDLVAEDEYLNLLNKNLVSIQFSISGGNENLTKKIEPGAPTVERRLKALRTLSDESFWTTVRLNPFFPIYPDGYYTDEKSILNRFGSKENIPSFELFDWSFIDQLADAKVPSVLAGFVRLSSSAINRLTQATNIDIQSFFKPENIKGRTDRRYSDPEIAYYYKKLQQICSKNKIRFNTCYIGNGEKDYYQYQNLWSNPGDCCDAKGNVPTFRNTSQDISWEERIKHAPNKEIAERAMLQEIGLNDKFSISNLNRLPGLKIVASELVNESFSEKA